MYTPVHISPDTALSPRQRLAQMRKAIELHTQASQYWPDDGVSAAVSRLSKAAQDLADEIRKVDEAVYGKAVLRPVFVNTATGGTMRAVVYPPDDTLDMPHIDELSWDGMRRILGLGDIEVDAGYDVYIVRGKHHHIIDTIYRFG